MLICASARSPLTTQMLGRFADGWHEPEASHLELLTAFLSAEQMQTACEEAMRRQYLWRECGDLNLIL
jgi:S-adenosylmethionine:tRNA-ribosyltransferase-isomerase (queuine synthetase)